MTATEPLTAASTSALFGRALRGTTVGLLLIVSVIAFEAIAVATALPTVVRSLHGLAYYGWPFTAFLVSNVTGIVLGGELSDRIGPRLPVFTGLGVFVGGLVVAGTAPWMSVFVLGRFIQGLGSGLVVVAIFVVIADVYDDPLRAKVFGLLSAAWVLPSLIGPVIAGALAQHVTWRLVFLGIPPLVAVALVLIVPGMRRSRRPATDVEAARVPMRWPFALLAAGGVALLQYAGQRRDVLSLFLLVAGAALLIPAVRVLLPRGSVTLRRGLPAVIGLRGIGAGAFFAVDALVPLTLTVVHGYSATEAGIPLTLGAVGWASASWLQGRMPNARRDRLVALGMGFVASAALLMAAVSLPAAPGWLSYPAWVFGGFGMGWIMPAVSLLTIDLSPVAERGRNSAALQISDVLASAICIGIGGALVAAAEGGAFGLPVAVRAVDLSMAALAFLGALLAGRARPR